MHTGLYTEEEFRSLGIMATFVTDEMFLKLDRSFFVDSLEFLQGFCYSPNKRDLVAKMLEEQWTFGYGQLKLHFLVPVKSLENKACIKPNKLAINLNCFLRIAL